MSKVNNANNEREQKEQKQQRELLWGISSDAELPKWDDIWELVCEFDEEIVFQTKKTYLHEDECEFGNFTFEYKYVLVCAYNEDYSKDTEEEQYNWYLELYMCPLIKCLNPKIIEDLVMYNGVELENLNLYDLILTKQCPLLEHSKFENCDYDFVISPNFESLLSTQGEEILSKAGVCIDLIDSMRGFCLDKIENGLGNTGWDFLKELIYNEDSVNLAMKRFEEWKQEQEKE